MQRYHEQRGPGLRNKVIHVAHPLAKDTLLCGRDVNARSMQATNRGAINCVSCRAVVLMCKAIPKRMTNGTYDPPSSRVAVEKQRSSAA